VGSAPASGASVSAPLTESDNGFQGNEPAQFLTGTFDSVSTANYIDISGVTDPAPISVYQTCRISWTSSPITYSFANLPAQSLTVRLHFAQIYYAYQYYGAQYFDISINSTLKTSHFDIWAAAGGAGDKAVVMEYPNITPLNGAITVTITPQPGGYGEYSGEINAIEIVKP